MIEHVEQEMSRKAVQIRIETCEQRYKQRSREEKTGHWMYSLVLLKWPLTMIEQVAEKNIFFAAFRGKFA